MSTDTRYRITGLHPGQAEVAASDARFRVLCCGQRWGKTRLAVGLLIYEALCEMERLVDLGAADYRAWAELLTTIETRRRLVHTERRRLEAAQQMITTERAMLLVAALVDAVRRHVDDRKVLDAIGREVERIVVFSQARGPHLRERD